MYRADISTEAELDGRISFGKGKDGALGVTFTPSMSEDGTLTWTNDGGKENPLPINLKGPAGAKGTAGEKGDQGPEGPKGDKGDKGDQGQPGIQGPKGEKGDKGEQGSKGVPGPQGLPGLPGPEGPQGERGRDGAPGEKGDKGDSYEITEADYEEIASVVEEKYVAELNDVKKTNASQDREIANIKVAIGKLYTEEISEDTAYSKDIPTDVLPYGTFDYLGGRSVVKNQICVAEDGTATNGGVTRTIENGLITVTGKKNNSSRYNVNLNFNPVKASHKYFCKWKNITFESGILYFSFYNSATASGYVSNFGSFSDEDFYGIADITTDGFLAPSIVATSGTEYNRSGYATIIDLTQMFGSGNELDLETCKELFTEDYYPYNAGEIKNAEVESVLSKGKNLISGEMLEGIGCQKDRDGSYRIISGTVNNKRITLNCEKNTSYTLSVKSKKISAKGSATISYKAVYDDGTEVQLFANGTSDSDTEYTAKSKTTDATKTLIAIKFGQTYAGEVNAFIQLEKGSTATEYKPYHEPIEKIIKPIVDKYFPNGMKSAGAVHDLFDVENGVAINRIKKYVCDEKQDWRKSSIVSTGFFFYTNNDGVRTSTDVITNLKKNIVRDASAWKNTANVLFLEQSSSGLNDIGVRMDEENITDITSFLNYIKNYPFEICAEYKEPITTPIAPEDLEVLKTLQLEGGGSLEFYQSDMKVPVPNKESWLVKTGGV